MPKKSLNKCHLYFYGTELILTVDVNTPTHYLKYTPPFKLLFM